MYIKKSAVFYQIGISVPKWDKCTIMDICPGWPEFQITGKYLKQTWGVYFSYPLWTFKGGGAKFISTLEFLKIKKPEQRPALSWS